MVRLRTLGCLMCLTVLMSQPVLANYPDDPLFPQQWALSNTYGPDLGALAGWQFLASQNTDAQDEIVIGLIDTGIDYRHPDLRQAIWHNPFEMTGQDLDNNGIDDGCEDGQDNGNTGYVDDCFGINTRVERWLDAAQTVLNPAAGDPMDIPAGHGTNMAGVIAATANNADPTFTGGMVGITGFTPRIKIVTCAAADEVSDAFLFVPLKALFATESAVLACLDYFLNLADRGVNLAAVNASGGASSLVSLGYLYAQVRERYLLNTPAMHQTMAALQQRNIALIAAAGNYGWDTDSAPERAYYPAAFDYANIISVGAIDSQGSLASFSSYGRQHIDVVAPGQGIVSASPSLFDAEGRSIAQYLTSDGTSQATAFVTGIVALLKANAATQSLTPAGIRRLLMSSGTPLPELSDRIRSGVAVKLAATDGSGALTCQDRVMHRSLMPLDSFHRLPGDTMTLKVERFRCAEPDQQGAVTVWVAQTQEQIVLNDDGVNGDVTPGDGVFSADWAVPAGHLWLDLDLGMDSATGQQATARVATALIVDNSESNTHRAGSWWPTIFRPGFFDHNYYIAYASSRVRNFTWLPEIERAGRYQLKMYWPAGPFATNAPVQWHYRDSNGAPQQQHFTLNQREHGGEWVDLGEVDLATGVHELILSNAGADGTVAADAIMLEWVGPSGQ